MKRFNLQIAAALLLLLGGTMLTGCGEDDPVTPPDFGESKVTFLHANPGRTSGVAFFRGDTVRVGSGTVGYSEFFTATTPNNPSVKYSVKATDGTTLRSKSGTQDSTHSLMIIYSGSATSDSLFFASSTPAGSGGTNALVRFIHAAQGAGARDLRIGEVTGPAIASSLRYKEANGSYITVNTTTDTLWIVDPADTTHNVAVPVNLTAGQGYSVVFMGVEEPVDPLYGWKGLIIADPN